MGQYSDLFDDAADPRAALNLRTAEMPPDRAAEALGLARRYNLPPAVAKQFVEDYRARAVADDAKAALERAPRLRSWVADDQTRAEASADDIGTLAKIEQTIGGIASYVMGARPSGGMPTDIAKAVRSLVAGASDFGAGAYGAAAYPLEAVGLDNAGGFLRYLQRRSTQAGDAIAGGDPASAGFLERSLLSGFRSAGQNLVTLPLGFTALGSAGTLGAMGVSTFGQTYGKGRDAGQGPGAAAFYGAQDATAEVVTEKYLGAAKLIGDAKAGMGAAKLFIRDIAREIPGEMGATLWQNFNEWANLNPEKSVSEFLAEQPEALAQTVIATVVGGGVQVGAIRGVQKAMGDGARREAEAAAAEAMAGQLTELQQFATASKVNARDGQTFREFIAQVADEEGEAPTEFYVDGQTLLRTLDQSGMTMAELEAVAPVAAGQVGQRSNLAPFGDVRVPVSEFLALGDKATGLIDAIRTAPGAMNRLEAAAWMTEKGAAIQADVERELQRRDDHATFRESIAAVQSEFEAELGAVGRFRPEVNKAYATLLANFYGATAARLGMTPQELLAKYRLRVAGQQAAVGSRVVEQAPGITITDGFQSIALGDTTVDISTKDGHAAIDMVATPKDKRGQGSARAALEQIVRAADAQGITLTLTAEPMDRSTSKAKLEKFYRSIGFVPNKGRNKDYRYSGAMIRRPQALATGNRGTFDPSDPSILNQAAYFQAAAEYQGSHKPPGPDSASLHDLTANGTYPDDVYGPNGARYYGDGSARDAEAFSAAFRFKGRPNASVTIYRAVPYEKTAAEQIAAIEKQLAQFMARGIVTAEFGGSRTSLGDGDGFHAWATAEIQRLKDKVPEAKKPPIKINAGDWVTLTRSYAVEHGVGALGGNYKIISKTVKAKELFTNGDSIQEWGYWPDVDTYNQDERPAAAKGEGPLPPRAQISLPQDFASESAVIRLLERADLSSFIHESGHLFLEIHADLAVKIQAQIDAGESVSDGERGIVEDMNRLLEWFGIKGVEQASGAGGGALDQPAYHGTPYRGIDKFSTDKIGTGEGAQAYGWGLYFASKKEIAEHYRGALAGEERVYSLNGVVIDPETLSAQEKLALQIASRPDQYSIKNVESAGARPEAIKTLKALVKKYKGAKYEEKPKGQLYEVEVPDDDTLLLWDKPLSEQPVAVRDALEDFADKHRQGEVDTQQSEAISTLLDDAYEDKTLTGRDLYEKLAYALGDRIRQTYNIDPNQKNASEALQALGIKGIKYLDGTSRGAGDGTFNYVVFSGDDVAIRSTFYQGGPEGAPQPPSQEGRTPLETWAMMSLEEKRQFHEQFARGFEAFAFEGKAPSLELRSIFQRFRSWLMQVYKTLRNLNVTLTDDVRHVMGRMLATDLAIEEAEAARNMGALFTDPTIAEKHGVTLEAYNAMHALAGRATEAAVDALGERTLRDMKWMGRARDRALKDRQREVEAIRREVRMEARAEVLAEPVYRAWQFLTAKAPADETAKGKKPSGTGQGLDRERDSLIVAIAKLGGIDRASAARDLSMSADYFSHPSGVFGKPVFRKTGGLSVDYMAEALAEQGYLPVDEDGKHEIRDLEDRIQAELGGDPQYSYWKRYEDGPDRIVGDVVAGKLRTSDVKGYGAEALAKLTQRKMVQEEGGLQADQVAELFPPFQSGEELVRALVDAPPLGDAVESRTDQIMMERFGDITSEEGLRRAADEAIHNEARARFVAAELKALADANRVREADERKSLFGKGTIDVLAKAAREFAAAAVNRQRIRDLRPDQYAGSEMRNAKMAEKALAAGKVDEAAMHKRNQLVNTYATKAAYEAKAEVKKALEFFAKVNKGGADKVAETRDVGIVNVARAILAAHGIGAQGEKAADYLRAVESSDPDAYKVLRDRVEAMTAGAQPYRDMTVEQFRGLADGVRDLWAMAKRSRQVEIDGKLIDRTKVQLELVDRLEAIGVPDRVPGEGSAVTDGERRIAKLRGFKAALRRVESWADTMDGGGMGPFRRYVWQPVKEAADQYRTVKAQFLRRYRDMLQTVDLGRARIDAPELGYVFGKSSGGSGRQEILHAILHTGNDSNKRKLLLGRGWASETKDGALDTTPWDSFVARMVRDGVLTKADFDFAQSVWDLLEETKPLAQKAHKSVFGHYFAEVTAEPFTMTWPDGQTSQYRGGYVPATADPAAVQDAAVRAMMEDENASLAFAFPATAKGFTKSRVEYNTKLLLDLRSLAQHIDKVLLFAHLEQPIRDVRKVLTSKDVAGPLGRIDPVAFGALLTPWLNRAARQSVETPTPGDNGMMRFFTVLRSRAGMAAMFANLANTAQQITGLPMAAVRGAGTGQALGPHLLRAAAQWMHSPRQTARAVAAASQYMATRMDNEVAMMSSEINDILLNPGVYDKAQAWTARHAYFMQSAVDNVIGPIVWQAAYNQALEQGQSEQDARRLADAAVRQTQGSTLAEDVSRIETGNPFVRMFTQFYGYFNMQANLLGGEWVKLMRESGLRAGMGRGIYIFTLGFLVPALVSEAIVQAFRGGPDDEDKDGEWLDDWLAALGIGTLRSGLAMTPGVGPALTASMNAWNSKPYDDRISTSPAISMIESAARSPASVYKAVAEDGDARKAVRDVASLISLTTGLPAGALARPLGYGAAVAQDKVDPTSAADAARGLVTGVASPESKQ